MAIVAQEHAVNARLRRAINQAGLSVHKVEKHLRLPAGFLDWIHDDQRSTQCDGMVIAIGELCKVDPRWLAHGTNSDAARVALAGFDRVFEHSRLPSEELRKLRRLFESLPQPPLVPGICRYCGCVDERACPGGCTWADNAHTICSACLFGD